MSRFNVVEHLIDGQHIREYRQATANSQEDLLQICVKQYIPVDNPTPEPGDVTIIGAHANAFPKEMYEPLWEDLLEQSRKQGWRIRSIWTADCAHQGQSGIVNGSQLGDQPSWNDHARDLLHLINVKRKDMPRPIVGVGHSMGGSQLAYLSLMHPRLLSALILLDPTVVVAPRKVDAAKFSPAMNMSAMSTFRRDVWPSLQKAKDSFAKIPFYNTWDQRVFDQWMEYGFSKQANLHHPDLKPEEVTLATPVPHEVFSYIRPNYEGYGHDNVPMNYVTHADVDRASGTDKPLYRPEARYIYRHLPELRPSVLWIFGAKSPIGNVDIRKDMVAKTGVGVGGSGGEAEGRVKGVTLEKVGHLVPMDAPRLTADTIAEWLLPELKLIQDEEARWRQDWDSKTLKEKQSIDETFKGIMRSAMKRPKL